MTMGTLASPFMENQRRRDTAGPFMLLFVAIAPPGASVASRLPAAFAPMATVLPEVPIAQTQCRITLRFVRHQYAFRGRDVSRGRGRQGGTSAQRTRDRSVRTCKPRAKSPYPLGR